MGPTSSEFGRRLAARASGAAIASADSVSVFEDLGIQQAPNSTLCSYVNRMLWILTGNFGNPGGVHLHTSFVNLFRDRRVRRTPVTGARILAGLVPCNVIPDEILTDHPDRFRAMIVESANPAHSLADSERFREAFEALDLVVVIDVAMTETARQLRRGVREGDDREPDALELAPFVLYERLGPALPEGLASAASLWASRTAARWPIPTRSGGPGTPMETSSSRRS